MLIINNNEITELPDTLQQLTALAQLNVEHNQIASLPPNMQCLERLQVFKASHNKLHETPWQLAWLPLRTLELDGNEGLELPDAVADIGLSALLSYLQVRLPLDWTCNGIAAWPLLFNSAIAAILLRWCQTVPAYTSQPLLAGCNSVVFYWEASAMALGK